ncbi:hypothetical protein OAH03_06695, partial [Akkermansiaceae bacterium]|nr:hypothetical protein [Akkermansiaceae bacterium]
SVNDIPKGSRLAVSTNLLAALISACMRATGQTQSLTGELTENERRLVLARAILGEWIGGSGGGWQDSGGVWPGIKLIEGELAGETDPEHGISRGLLGGSPCLGKKCPTKPSGSNPCERECVRREWESDVRPARGVHDGCGVGDQLGAPCETSTGFHGPSGLISGLDRPEFERRVDDKLMRERSKCHRMGLPGLGL